MPESPITGSVNLEIDALGIGNAIADAVKSAQNREGFVQNLVESTYFSLGQKYNVLVCNLNQHPQTGGLNNVVLYGSGDYGGILFGIWGFTHGEFTHEGDGGWINWAMKGSFTRDGDGGKHVIFYAFAGSVTVYDESRYAGFSQNLGVGRYSWGDIHNDTISSLQVSPGTKVTVYSDTRFSGNSRSFTQDVPWIGDEFNDKISSLIVEIA